MLMMDSVSCNVIYVDRHIREDRVVSSADYQLDGATNAPQSRETPSIEENINVLLDVFGDIHLCATGTACITQLLTLQDGSLMDLRPTIVLIDIPHDERVPSDTSRSRPTSPRSTDPFATQDLQIYPETEVYGLSLLQKIVSEAHLRNLSRLVVPIPVVSFLTAGDQVQGSKALPERRAPDRTLVKRCLDLGATDIMVSPMIAKCVTSLEIHAYRAHKEAARDQQAMLEIRRGRKRSWVGLSDSRPFAYLREAMVSTLMKRICQLEDDADERIVESVRISVSSDRKARIASAIGQWHFSAHDYTDDELIVVASMIFRHALGMPELERWRIPADYLLSFLIACRAAYNAFVPYHNFRHVVDVLQATFHFLLSIGALPPYAGSTEQYTTPATSPIARLVEPFEALTLLITAIGHDVGHPGVNNGFLVVLNAPLAQLYNDRSVLESFHCAAYSQILRRYWPSVFADTKMRNLMISSILATDMGLHFDYMKKMGDIQEKLSENNTTDGWNGRMIEEQKALACALLIKCADISNVTRNHSTALQWMHILSDEFSRQASMENELQITSSLMSPPKSDLISLAKAQLGFMNLFAIPLFQGVADIMPAMQYCVDELETNKTFFESTIAEEQAGASQGPGGLGDGTFSPRTLSIAVDPVREKGWSDSNGCAPSFSSTTRASYSKEVRIPQADSTSKPAHIPVMFDEYKEVSGAATQQTLDFAHSDPFALHEGRRYPSGHQRSSEATEGSVSAHGTGDRASQATSATTGRMPLSPSTQGTSIISNDSMDRPTSLPVTTITAPDLPNGHEELRDSSAEIPSGLEDASSVSSAVSNGKSPDRKVVKKKSSRFRMNALNLFRRHKGTSPPLPPADSVT